MTGKEAVGAVNENELGIMRNNRVLPVAEGLKGLGPRLAQNAFCLSYIRRKAFTQILRQHRSRNLSHHLAAAEDHGRTVVDWLTQNACIDKSYVSDLKGGCTP